MNLDPKSCEVGEDEIQASCELFAFLKREHAIVYVQDAEEGKESFLGEVLLLVTGKPAYVARGVRMLFQGYHL